jgi:hypothetical protein
MALSLQRSVNSRRQSGLRLSAGNGPGHFLTKYRALPHNARHPPRPATGCGHLSLEKWNITGAHPAARSSKLAGAVGGNGDRADLLAMTPFFEREHSGAEPVTPAAGVHLADQGADSESLAATVERPAVLPPSSRVHACAEIPTKPRNMSVSWKWPMSTPVNPTAAETPVSTRATRLRGRRRSGQ